MKTILLALMLILTGLELQAQPAPGVPAGTARRPLRYGLTNNVPGTQPRYQQPPPGGPGAVNPAGATAPAGAPGGVPGAPPGGPGTVPANLSSAPPSATFSSALDAQPEEMIAPGTIDFEGVDLNEVLLIYAKLVNRTLLRAALPQAQIILKTQTPLTKTEAIQALQAVLALNGVSLVNIGDKFVKVVPSTDAGGSGGEIDRTGSTNLPALGSYVTHVVQLKYVKPSEMKPIIDPFGKLKDTVPLDGNGILVIRDYAENVKRMLEMIEQVDVSVPAEYISEVIPIRYAKVDDIASALNALGGSGSGASVSIGTAPTSGTISGFSGGRSSSFGTQGGVGGGIGGGLGGSYGGVGGYQSSGGLGSSGITRSFGGSNPNGTPSGTAQSFQQRLQNIVNATTGGGGGSGQQTPIQLFGQTKIIPNESSSSLLIYATRADMDVIKGIIGKLDQPLPQVLVEAAIIDYSLGPDTFNFGVSAAQNPAQNGAFIGGGGMNNASSGNPFIQFVQNITSITNGLQTNGLFSSISHVSSISASGSTNGSSFANSLPGGLSYFGNIGPNWDVAMTAAAGDSHASVIQRPRIQTSQAKAAQFFVGDTVPYVTGNSYGTVYGSGVSYSQLSVGVELDVTPFINPEGLVVMDIQQEIDDLNGYTVIANVGNVPNTIKRTLNAEIAVRDRDTVMLGGFIKSDKSTGRSGVPFLMDIPILGNLFTQRSDSKKREELIVLMRPTVLNTPELAAKNTLKEEQRLPGVARAEADDANEQHKNIEAERKSEMRRHKADPNYEGFFTHHPDPDATNAVPLDLPKTSEVPPSQPGTEVQEVTPVPQPVHPQPQVAPVAPAPATQQDSAALQQQAAAALAQKMMELNAGSTNRAH